MSGVSSDTTAVRAGVPDDRTGVQASLPGVPLAMVDGEPLRELPQDLYIPPEALRVILEAFEGPLDLLLYLIRRQNLDILDIPIAEITRQYMAYIDMMHDVTRLDLAAEYLVMAAMLAEIKSRLLLPRPELADDEEEDPRAELVRRLQEYERFKQAAEDLDSLPREERDFTVATAHVDSRETVRLPPPVDLRELLSALQGVLQRASLQTHHQVAREPLSVRERMSDILAHLGDGLFHPFDSLFRRDEGRQGIIVNFVALLELAKEQLVAIVQNEPLGVIHIKALATLMPDAP